MPDQRQTKDRQRTDISQDNARPKTNQRQTKSKPNKQTKDRPRTDIGQDDARPKTNQ